MPCPYQNNIVGTRHCRVLRLYHSDANGIGIMQNQGAFFVFRLQLSINLKQFLHQSICHKL